LNKDIINLELLEKIGQIAIIAGRAVMEIYKKDFDIKEKKPNHPVTEADYNSHNIIKNSLENLKKEIPFFSEESDHIPWEERKKWKNYWLVDPLDGTKEFIKKNGEFTINIALISSHFPILGVVYAPTISRIYLAAKNLGCFIKKASINENNFHLNIDSKLIAYKEDKFSDKKLNIISSRSHINDEKMKKWLKIQNEYNLNYSGSSIKFCLVAEGKADIYPRFKPTSEWDTAAGHCILKEAGGNIRNLDGDEIKYNTKDSVINPEFIASRF
tara:strand:- start:19522 stop:20334 length:813 start_codon:yes stop_codon:yes gene_type:complete